MTIVRLLLIGWLGVFLFTPINVYGLAQEPPREETSQETSEAPGAEPQEKQPFFQKLLAEIGNDLATSEALIRLGPRTAAGQTGRIPVSSSRGPYEGGEWFQEE